MDADLVILALIFCDLGRNPIIESGRTDVSVFNDVVWNETGCGWKCVTGFEFDEIWWIGMIWRGLG